MSKQRQQLSAAIQSGKFVAAPGVFELISVKIASEMNFDALYMTGYGTVASYLGLPDAGLATYSQMVDRVAQICGATDKPVICDGDTGYGGLLNVKHTVQGYERAGAAAIQMEDQEFPKKCGHTPGRRVIPVEDMVQKIKVAADARENDDFLIVARTDARTGYGLDEAINRGLAFEDAGADIIFVESPESEAEMEKICRAMNKPTLCNVVDGGSTPVLPADQLKELGYAMAIYPGSGFLAMGAALRDTYRHIDATGSSAGLKTPVYEFGEFNKLMGFQEVWDFDQTWQQPE